MCPQRVLATAVFAELWEAVLDEGREDEAFKCRCDAERAQFALGLVLRAATKGEAHSRATEATKAVVFNFVNENIKHTSPEIEQSPWRIRIRPGGSAMLKLRPISRMPPNIKSLMSGGMVGIALAVLRKGAS